MKRKRHTEEQIIGILREHEAGMKTADLCRKHGISEGCFYNWKAKYGGLRIAIEIISRSCSGHLAISLRSRSDLLNAA
jgi:putative transposase